MFAGLKALYSEDGQTVSVEGNCVITKNPHRVSVDAVRFRSWVTGNGLIQDVFPGMSREDREFLISGVSGEGWNQMFGGNDE